ncbi:MAG: TetR/AcrR family transcriptional regulator [Kibdelosporangium sp.]
MRRTAAQTREHILEVAHELFYWQGIRATGIDRVAAEAGVAPTTLYRLFESKDDLVAAYVDRAHDGYRRWFADAVASAGADPRKQIVALFAQLTGQVQPDRCRGCPFLMALAEFPDPDSAPHRNAVAMKAWVRAEFGALAEVVAPATAAVLADQLALAMEGVYASVQALGVSGPVANIGPMIELLLDAHIG